MEFGIAVCFCALGVHPRIPGSRINLHALYRVGPENSSGGKYFTNRKPNLRPDSSRTHRTGSRRARGPSASPGIQPSLPASAGSARLRLDFDEEGRGFFQEGVLHLELAYAPFRLAKLAALGLRVGFAGKLAPVVLHPFVHGLGIQAELCAAFRYRPARRDDVVGGLSPELVSVPGGWVWHGIPSPRSSLNEF